MASTEENASVEFAKLAARISRDLRVDKPDVAKAKGFGSKGLKVERKMFAFHSKGQLVVKLSAERVDALVAGKKGERFDPGHGRLMKEWLAVDFAQKKSWLKLAQEELEHAVGNPSK